MGENICILHIQKGVDIENIYINHTTQQQKSNKLTRKWANDVNR